MMHSIKNTTRAQGMATLGTEGDPHLMCITGDGAGVSAKDSGVRVGHFPGSTNLLNQSSLDMVTWLFYRESCKAEDYTVLAGRLSGVLPDMCRLFNHGEAGELLLDGVSTGVFVKFVLVADKPFIRHVCGLLSHNADAFGAPFCECCDETDRPALYDFTRCTETHYGGTTFADLCHRAHCATWEALGEKEPEGWHFECPCCQTAFGTDHGGRAALDEIDAKLHGMEPGPLASTLKTHAKTHLAQMLRRWPLLPFHYVTHDPMHGVHNEANAVLDEAVHKHLMVESTDAEVKKTLEIAQAAINTLWKAANLPKYIQFGRDGQGAHSHALNGPCFEKVWSTPQLIIDTITLMGPVYALLESKKLVPELTPEALAAGDLEQAAAAVGAKRTKGRKAPPAKKKRAAPKRNRRADFGDEDDEFDEDAPVLVPLNPALYGHWGSFPCLIRPIMHRLRPKNKQLTIFDRSWRATRCPARHPQCPS